MLRVLRAASAGPGAGVRLSWLATLTRVQGMAAGAAAGKGGKTGAAQAGAGKKPRPVPKKREQNLDSLAALAAARAKRKAKIGKPQPEGFHPDMKDWKAVAVYDYVQRRFGSKLPPPRTFFEAFVSKISEPKHVNMAAQLLENYKRFHTEMPPNVTARLLKMCCKAKAPEAALNLVNRHTDLRIWPTLTSLHYLMVSLGLNGHFDKAQELMKRLPRLGLVANDDTYTAMIRSATHAGKLDEALALMDKCHASPWPNNPERKMHPATLAYRALITALDKAGRTADAERVKQVMKERLPESKAKAVEQRPHVLTPA